MTLSQALSAFEDGLRVRSRTPVSGFSEAAFLLVQQAFGTDVDRAVRLAKRWKTVLAIGDDPGYAYRVKGLGEWADGKFSAAAQSFLEAGRTQQDGSGSFAVPAIDAFARAGDVDSAIQTAEQLSEQFNGAPLLSAKVAANLANAYEQADRLGQAISQYRRAVSLFDGLDGSDIDLGKCLTGLAACAWQLGNVSEARSAGERAVGIFEEQGLTNFADVARANLAQIANLEGRLDEAVRTLTELQTRFEGPRRAWVAEMLGFIYRRLNLVNEAADCFEEALEEEDTQKSGCANASAGLGLSLTELGQETAAREHIRRAGRIYRQMGNRLMPALLDLDRSQLASGLGRYTEAGKLARAAASVLEDSGAAQDALLGLALAAEASVLSGVSATPIVKLTRRLVASQSPNLVWRGRYLRALSEGGNRLEFRKMLKALLENRLLLSSPLSRAAFWGDKRRAIDAYLRNLLATGTRRDLSEAFSVVSQVRSATLIDEILQSSEAFDDRRRQALIELRSELNQLHEREGIPPQMRLSRRSVNATAGVTRHWHETAEGLLSGQAALVELSPDPECVTLLSVDGTVRMLTPAGVEAVLPASVQRIEELTSIFHFECMEPIVNPQASARHCVAALRDLMEACYGDLREARVRTICPDDSLWSVPWQAFPMLAGDSWELAQRLTPLASNRGRRHVEGGRVAIWIGDATILPNLARERDLLLERFPDALVCQSREDALRLMEGGEFGLVHISAHSKHHTGNPMFSSIDFPDGPLFAVDIAAMNFRVDRAVLLSCESGRVTIPHRREPDGLSRAFLSRGATEVLGSSWLLDDEAALRLFQSIYGGKWEQESLEALIAKARRELCDWKEHPFYWGAPVLIRGYGRTPTFQERTNRTGALIDVKGGLPAKQQA